MKISLVTISFNQKTYLERCLNSVVSQELPSGVQLEYIVVDPGSTDGSREIINRYEDVVKVFEQDSGPSDGLAKGLNLATGDILGFINADDYLLPEALASVIDAFKKSNADVITGPGYIERSTGEKSLVKPTKFNQTLLRYKAGVIFQQGTFFTREVYKLSGGINNKNKTSWDFELFYNFSKLNVKHVIISNKILAVFFVHDDSISGSQRFNKINAEEIDNITNMSSDDKFYYLTRLFLRVIRRLI